MTPNPEPAIRMNAALLRTSLTSIREFATEPVVRGFVDDALVDLEGLLKALGMDRSLPSKPT